MPLGLCDALGASDGRGDKGEPAASAGLNDPSRDLAGWGSALQPTRVMIPMMIAI
jgi:hypothetical protein